MDKGLLSQSIKEYMQGEFGIILLFIKNTEYVKLHHISPGYFCYMAINVNLLCNKWKLRNVVFNLKCLYMWNRLDEIV